MESEPAYWGLSCSIDPYECDLYLMQDAEAIKESVRQPCDRIKMRRHGETRLLYFGDGPWVTRFSMTQLIETTLISAHFADASCAVYPDLFNCAPHEPGALV